MSSLLFDELYSDFYEDEINNIKYEFKEIQIKNF